jgi:hypothetical protein
VSVAAASITCARLTQAFVGRAHVQCYTRLALQTPADALAIEQYVLVLVARSYTLVHTLLVVLRIHVRVCYHTRAFLTPPTMVR